MYAPRDIAIICGSGALPGQIKRALPGIFCLGLEQAIIEPGVCDAIYPIEKLGAIFQKLHQEQRQFVCFAGGVSRPHLDPSGFDSVMRAAAPGLMAAMGRGDDHVLRHVIALFETAGFTVLGVEALCPEFLMSAGHLAGPKPDTAFLKDAQRGITILEHIAELDIAQAAIVEAGLCLGIETIQGTDVLLKNVAQTLPRLRRQPSGLLIKVPKHGQELRVDMPAIGALTIKNIAAAGLRGLVGAAEQIVMIERDEILNLSEQLGVTLFGWEVKS